jgi:hypothetical protein
MLICLPLMQISKSLLLLHFADSIFVWWVLRFWLGRFGHTEVDGQLEVGVQVMEERADVRERVFEAR